jgi:hypothetical protein
MMCKERRVMRTDAREIQTPERETLAALDEAAASRESEYIRGATVGE